MTKKVKKSTFKKKPVKKIISKPDSFLKKSPKAKDVVLVQTKTGFYIYGGRARSNEYKTINSIPKSVIEFIESTN